MQRKAVMKLQVRREGAGMEVLFYLGAAAFGSHAGKESVAVRILRKAAPGFVFNEDYDEYFGGASPEGAEVLYEGPLPLGNGRKVVFEDRSAQPGQTYLYWAALKDDPAPPAGPVAARLRDELVWWPLATVERRLRELAARGGTLWEAGQTARRAPLSALRVGNPGRCIGLVGAVHAGEAGPELIVPVLERLVAEDAALLERVGVVAVPVVNADERERQAAGVPHYLRTNANGVDLNRNFPADWEETDPSYGLLSSDPDAVTYRGPAPASEGETRALMRVMEETRPEAVFSMHCLAGICSPVFLASRAAREDAAFRARVLPLLEAYTLGYYVEAREPQLKYACSVGSLPHWLYLNGGAPCFDLEWDGDPATRACINDGTTPGMIATCAEAHYRGIRAVLAKCAGV